MDKKNHLIYSEVSRKHIYTNTHTNIGLSFNITIFPNVIWKVLSKKVLTYLLFIYTDNNKHNGDFGHRRIILTWHNFS